MCSHRNWGSHGDDSSISQRGTRRLDVGSVTNCIFEARANELDGENHQRIFLHPISYDVIIAQLWKLKSSIIFDSTRKNRPEKWIPWFIFVSQWFRDRSKFPNDDKISSIWKGNGKTKRLGVPDIRHSLSHPVTFTSYAAVFSILQWRQTHKKKKPASCDVGNWQNLWEFLRSCRLLE